MTLRLWVHAGVVVGMVLALSLMTDSPWSGLPLAVVGYYAGWGAASIATRR